MNTLKFKLGDKVRFKETGEIGEVIKVDPNCPDKIYYNVLFESCCDDWCTEIQLEPTNTFKKHDDNKPRFSLIPQEALDELLTALEYGAQKYDEDPNDPNWAKGDPKRYLDAAMRHIMATRRGEEIDLESGIKHLTLAMTNLVFIASLNVRQKKVGQ